VPATEPASGPVPAGATTEPPLDLPAPVAVRATPAADRARLVTVAGALTVLLAAAGLAFVVAIRRRRHPIAVPPPPSSDVEIPERFG
jgi:hypothetical protein